MQPRPATRKGDDVYSIGRSINQKLDVSVLLLLARYTRTSWPEISHGPQSGGGRAVVAPRWREAKAREPEHTQHRVGWSEGEKEKTTWKKESR